MNGLEKSLLNDFQRDFPLSETPFSDIATRLGVDEAEVLNGLRELQAQGAVSRVGPVFQTGRTGASSLVAMAVPPERLEEVAGLVSACPETNHNYEREHRFNLWFVLTASSPERLQQVLDDIEQGSGIEPLVLPMVEAYHIDLGFSLQWS
jgi:DNA-binding Lrp family transcriptional regulator